MVLEHGEIKEVGTHKELISIESGIYAKFVKEYEGSEEKQNSLENGKESKTT